jgi:hypothetical protein
MQISKNREINFIERRTINLKASDRYSLAVMVTQLLFQVLKYKSARARAAEDTKVKGTAASADIKRVWRNL